MPRYYTHYRLQLPQDDSTPINDVLGKLDSHFRAQTNEALRKRELFTSKQEVGELFNDSFVRVKTLAEAVEICKGSNDECEQTQLKHVLLMGLRDQELVEDLVSIIPTKTLDEVVARCYAHEAARHTASDIFSNSQTVRATSKYKKEKSPGKVKNASHRSMSQLQGRLQWFTQLLLPAVQLILFVF